MQKTAFKIEILIGEDGSDDGTRDICLEYAERFPQKIKLFLHNRENNIKVGGLPTGRFNFVYNLFSAKGKYIAICDGDDYWTDPLKLQKQVEILEQNLNYGLSCTAYERFYQELGTIITPKVRSHQFTIPFETLIFKSPIKTCTVLLRKKIVHDYFSRIGEKIFKWQMGDAPLWLFTSLNSEIHFVNRKTAVYRILEKSATNVSAYKKLLFRMSRYKVSFFFLRQKFSYSNALKLIGNFLQEAPVLILKTILSFFNLYEPDKNKMINKIRNNRKKSNV